MAKTVETIFRFVNDRAAVQDVLRDSDRIDDALDQQVRSVKRLEDAYTAMEHTAERVARAERDASEARVRMARESAEIYGDVASRTTGIAGLAGNLSPVLGSRLMIAADILDATEASKLMHAELPKLTSQLATAAGGMGNLALAGGVAAAAVAGLYLAFNALGDAAEKSRAAVLAEIEFEERRAGLDIGGMTTADLNREIAALQDSIAARQGNIDALKEDRRALMDSFNVLEIAGEAAGVFNQGLDDYNAKINELQTAQTADLQILREYANALGTQDIALNDTRAAQEDYIKTLEESYARGLELDRKIATYTTEMIAQESAEIERQITARENQLQRLQAAHEAGTITETQFIAEAERLNGEIDGLRFQFADLNTLVRDAAKARESESGATSLFTDLLDKARDALKDVGTVFVETVQKLHTGAEMVAAYEAERDKVEADVTGRIVAAQAAYGEQRQRAIDEQMRAATEREQDHQERLAEMHTGFNERTSDIRREFERDESKRIRDHYRERQRAEEDSRATILDAAARLDASAVLAEQRRFARESTRAEEDFKAETDQRAEQLDERLKQEQKSHEARVKQAEAAYRKQEDRQRQQFDRLQSQRDADHNRQIADLRRQGQDRLTALETAHGNEIAQLFGFQSEEYTVRQEHYDKLRAQLSQLTGSTITAPPTGTGSGGGTITQPGAPGPGQYYYSTRGPVRYDRYDQQQAGGMTAGEWYAWKLAGRPHFKEGGYTPDGLIQSHFGEWVANRNTTRLLERGIGAPLTQQTVQRFMTSQRTTTVGNVTIHIDGTRDPRAVAEAVREELMHIVQQ
ncbi:MAG: hypothetical protein IT450_24290 [Phycisphaerales bacterium]|nr:hypothetical protein [Phycisphaerales bacterium]